MGLLIKNPRGSIFENINIINPKNVWQKHTMLLRFPQLSLFFSPELAINPLFNRRPGLYGPTSACYASWSRVGDGWGRPVPFTDWFFCSMTSGWLSHQYCGFLWKMGYPFFFQHMFVLIPVVKIREKNDKSVDLGPIFKICRSFIQGGPAGPSAPSPFSKAPKKGSKSAPLVAVSEPKLGCTIWVI